MRKLENYALINIHEAGILYIYKIYKKLEKPARNLKIFSHKFCALFYFSKNPHILPFFYFSFLNQANKPHNSLTKIFYICPPRIIISISFLPSFRLRPNCNKKHITTPIASAKHTFYLYFLSVNRAINSFQFLFYSSRRHKNKNIFFTYLPHPTRNTK